MRGSRPKPQVALDSNVLFDLADGLDSACGLREILLEKGYSLRVPPTVIQELAYLGAVDDGSGRAQRATKALQLMRSWQIHPFDLVSVGHGITEEFARLLMLKGFLPPEELNDGLILAETSLAAIPALVTCDCHLLGIDYQSLAIAFQDRDLSLVLPIHPRSYSAA